MRSVPRQLEPAALRCRYDPDGFPFQTTQELPDLDEVVGQSRAVAAVELGVGMARDGYHIFVAGAPGTGKHSFVTEYLRRRAAGAPAPPALCYVHNFADPHRPRLLALPPGAAAGLQADMDQFAENVGSTLARAFESEECQKRRRAIIEAGREESHRLLHDIEERARAEGLALAVGPGGVGFQVIREGRALTPEEFGALPEEERRRLEERGAAFEEELERGMRAAPRIEREVGQRVRAVEQEFAHAAVTHMLEEARERHRHLPVVLEYMDAVERDAVAHARELSDASPLQDRLMDALRGRPSGLGAVGRYRINVLVDRGAADGAPVVYEDNPTHDNLIGRIEHLSQFGALVTNFTLIKPGALYGANGGYLVLDARRLLLAPYAWDTLKRVLRARRVRIESLGQMLGLVSTVSLDPEPLTLDLQVVLLGEPSLYQLLCVLDPDFAEFFKIVADFDDRMTADAETRARYVRLLATLGRRAGLRPFDRTAVARLLEHSHRLAGDQDKLSARLAAVADLQREVDHWAAAAHADLVSGSHVQQAVAAQLARSDRLREQVYEEITRGTLMIDTDGERVGQVNGLSVIVSGTLAFGRPSRITSRVRLGQGNVIDIEREVELGGPVHSKGVLILAGYLGARYAPDHPFPLSASVVFEQSYAAVEGDSASSAELAALLSAIAEVPLLQSIAVTGSVSQRGQLQAVGAVTEKVEGFFDVCRRRGLTGRQGVVIPTGNVRHLMLRDDVVEAVAAGAFHVYPAATIDDLLEVLTGMEAGERDASGAYPEDSFNARVEARLVALAELWRTFNAPSVEWGATRG